MPRSIADITKELKVKQDTAAKTDAAIAKRTEDKKKQAGIIADLRPKISKLEILIGANEKALKDSKTKKENLKGLEAQKKSAQSELAPLEAKMDAAHKEYEVCEKLIETLSKGDQPIQASITKLQKELQDTRDGQVKYGQARAAFKTWYLAEIGKLKGMGNTIKSGQENVARLLTATEAAADKNDLDAAQSHAKQAAEAAKKNQAELDKFEAHQRTLGDKKLKARNLPPSEFGLVPADVQVHAGLNKDVLDLFAEEDKIAAKARARVKESDADAEEAAHRAAEGAKTAQNMSASLGRSLAALKAIDTEMRAALGTTWVKAITDEGATFTRITTEVKAVPPKPLDIPLKTYEQANTYVPEAFARLQRFNKRIQEAAKKAEDGVPAGLRDELSAELASIKKLAADSAAFIVDYSARTTKTLAELGKLKTALDARA